MNTKLKNAVRKSISKSSASTKSSVKKTVVSKTKTTNVSPLVTAMKLENAPTFTKTENGAKALSTTKSDVLDFYFNSGGFRKWSDAMKVKSFEAAFAENNLLSLKALFHMRDVRQGKGERDSFRKIITSLANKNPHLVIKNLENIPFYGRFDDLFCLLDTPVSEAVYSFIHDSLLKDFESETPTLLAKWMPSINCSSEKSRELARKFAKKFSLSEREYRKLLSKIRAKIGVLETTMCKKEWSSIDYSKVPSRASMIYRKAFSKNDAARYCDFLSKVEKGEVKINAATLFPHEVISKVQFSNDATAEALWKALPDYTSNKEGHALVVADVSGSMGHWHMPGSPMNVCVGLTMYLAERNSGMFKNTFITFSGNPTLHVIKGSTLRDKVVNISSASWEMNTNIQAVFDLILNTAKSNKISKSDMPTEIIIISDMQFDIATNNRKTNFEIISEKYKKSGYSMPKLIFWNVRSAGNVPVEAKEDGTVLVSGYSPSIMKNVLGVEGTTTPYDSMVEVLSDERYNRVVV